MPIHSNVLSKTPFVRSPLSRMTLPSSREAHFWYILPSEVENSLLLTHYLELISQSERKNVLQMNGDQLQKGALLSRVLLRTTLARYTNSKATPRSLEFTVNCFGKPEVQWPTHGEWDPPPLHFNVSHTSSMIACAVTSNSPIGIDVIEKHRQLKSNVLSFARRYFAPSEVEFLASFSDLESQREEFLKLWTLKEAYVKALGRGFSGAPFKYFAIEYFRGPISNVIKVIIQPGGDTQVLSHDWQFGLFELDSSHHAAICIKKSDEDEDPIRLKAWKIIPSVSEECVSGTNQVLTINGILDFQD